MLELTILNYVALSLYCLFVFITFCDGFGLHIFRKITWAVIFLMAAFWSLKLNNTLNLGLILPIPTVFAIYLCLKAKNKS